MPTAAACIDTGPCICDDKQGGQHADEERKRQRVSPGQGQEGRDVARNRETEAEVMAKTCTDSRQRSGVENGIVRTLCKACRRHVQEAGRVYRGWMMMMRILYIGSPRSAAEINKRISDQVCDGGTGVGMGRRKSGRSCTKVVRWPAVAWR